MVNRNGRWHYLQVHVTIASGRRRSYSVPAQWQSNNGRAENERWAVVTVAKNICCRHEEVKRAVRVFMV